MIKRERDSGVLQRGGRLYERERGGEERKADGWPITPIPIRGIVNSRK